MQKSICSARHATKLISNIRQYSTPYAASDFVLLRPISNKQGAIQIFLGPLVPGKSLDSHKGRIRHDEVIGKSARDVCEIGTAAGKSTKYRLQDVRLEEYVELSKRLVTPIYPQDAALIVNLFDLHPEVYDASITDEDAPRIDILEAGTGHGSLTLHLSRAIHAGNGAVPKQRDDVEGYEEALKTWKKTRRAVIHSVEVSEKHSKHAAKTVKAFRRGQYYNNIDFHVGDVGGWVNNTKTLFTHAFLDLPDVQSKVAGVASALKTDGMLIIFCPSISQINECALKVRKDRTRLELDRVVELGVNGGSGGRLWDIRLVKPRAMIKRTPSSAKDEQADETVHRVLPDDTARPEVSDDTVQQREDGDDLEDQDDWKLICRPKVGTIVTGGGFLAVFKKRSAEDKTRDSIETDLSRNESFN